jgi:hypothetical protein
MKQNAIQEGAVRPRPPIKRSQAHTGIQPLSPLTHRTQRFQPLPPPLGEPPYHYDLEAPLPGIGKIAKDAGKLVFHVVGDTGGIKHPEYQVSVARAMKEDLNKDKNERPNFFIISATLSITTVNRTNITTNFTNHMTIIRRPLSASREITTVIQLIHPKRHSMDGLPIL